MLCVFSNSPARSGAAREIFGAGVAGADRISDEGAMTFSGPPK